MRKFIIIFLLFLAIVSYSQNWYNYQEYWKVETYSEIDSLYVPNGLRAPRIYDITNLEADSIDIAKSIVDSSYITYADITNGSFGKVAIDSITGLSYITGTADVIADSLVNYGSDCKAYSMSVDFDSLKIEYLEVDSIIELSYITGSANVISDSLVWYDSRIDIWQSYADSFSTAANDSILILWKYATPETLVDVR
jgi:hypothetical protein